MSPVTSSPPLLAAVPLEHVRGLRLVGELDLSTVGLLLGALETLAETAEVLELSELSFMDASGLHALEQYAGALDGSAPLVLENVSRQVYRLFQITGADRNPAIDLRGGGAGG